MAGIYIHIPFCKKACTYCDFHFTTSFRYVNEMVDAICREIELKAHRLQAPIKSIYFGGGTPSVLPISGLQKIFDTLVARFSIEDGAEITLEANPDDLTIGKIRELRQLPVNRFSIGIQSFFEEDLNWMNRAHRATEAESSIKRSQDAGFENLSIDLIYGYPILTNEKWLYNIHKAVELGLPHISSYSLTVEAKTALANAIHKGKEQGMDDDQSAIQFQLLISELSASDYEHYEISNFSRPGKYAVHNTNYWKGAPYLGIGPAAHGFDGRHRYINVANNAKYLTALGQHTLAEQTETLTLTDRFNEYIMTSLRTMWGADLQTVEREYGERFAHQLSRELKHYVNTGDIILTDNIIRLSAKGKLFADGIAASLFAEDV